MAKRIEGKPLAQKIYRRLEGELLNFRQQFDFYPKLVAIIAGDNLASEVYVKAKKKKALALGMQSEIIALPQTISQSELLERINRLNLDPNAHGIMVQLPLPDHLDAQTVIAAIQPDKDVDGLTPHNVASLVLGQPALYPCTPLACIKLAKSVEPNLEGLHAVIIGRSSLVGRPLVQLLLHENCTVSVAHSKSQNLPELCRSADLLFAAAGKKHLVRADWVKPNSIIIDIGIHRQTGAEQKLTGDVAFDEVKDKVRAITPVPGGVGPMTVACLMENTLRAAYIQKKQKT